MTTWIVEIWEPYEPNREVFKGSTDEVYDYVEKLDNLGRSHLEITPEGANLDGQEFKHKYEIGTLEC